MPNRVALAVREPLIPTAMLLLLLPERLRERAAAHGITEVESMQVALLGARSFQVQMFGKVPLKCPESAKLTSREGM